MEPREEAHILDTAEIVGGKPLRALAHYFIDGTLPETETLQSVYDTLAKDEDDRVEAASLTQAASNKRLVEWAVSRNGCGARRLRELRQKNHGAYVTQVLGAMKDRSLSAAARVLGVSRRQLFRYAADVREYQYPHKKFHEMWAAASEGPHYVAGDRATWDGLESRLVRARDEGETTTILAEASQLSQAAIEGKSA